MMTYIGYEESEKDTGGGVETEKKRQRFLPHIKVFTLCVSLLSGREEGKKEKQMG